MGLDKPMCPVQPFHPQGERRVPPFLDLDLADGGTLARVSEESGLADGHISPQYAERHHHRLNSRGPND